MSRRALVPALALLAAASGCGGQAGDLFVVERTGSIPGARLTLIVDDSGFVRCNGGGRLQISSSQLIDAREIARALDGEDASPGSARKGLKLAGRPGSVLRYDVRSEAGSVAFADNSARQPPELYRVAKLTRDLAKQVCGLPR